MAWTEERVELLSKLWAEGKSASDIAKELGEVTRNAVIGKVHRLGLKGRGTSTAADATTSEAPKAPKAKAKPASAPKKTVTATAAPKVAKPAPSEPEAKVETPEVDDEDEDDSETPAIIPASNDEISIEAREKAAKIENESKRLNLMQLTERVCKWPVGDPATEDFWFCGHPSKPGKPYCEAHVELAFQAPMSRRDRK